MPAIIDYETLERTLAEEVVGKFLGKNVSVLIKAIRVRPYGERLLLETTVYFCRNLPYNLSGINGKRLRLRCGKFYASSSDP